ncbi:MAG TPA: DnaJ domain-containing protein [Thermomonas sp.]|nr:DnaJ domain-containing protein [Thermomonas sp.]
MTIPAYPLQWPAGWKRIPAHMRARARFVKKERKYHASGGSYSQDRELTIADGVDRVRAELTRMGVHDDDLVINSNLQLRLDGFPKSGQREPDDPGIVVYWLDCGETRCMAIDRYDRVADNLAAVAATLDAMRAIERHGGAEILNRAFTGFTALPSSAESWWGVLGVEANARPAEIEAAYRRRRSETHPDRGGSADTFDAVQRAYEQATRSAQS